MVGLVEPAGGKAGPRMEKGWIAATLTCREAKQSKQYGGFSLEHGIRVSLVERLTLPGWTVVAVIDL